jgi:hypothetical protein
MLGTLSLGVFLKAQFFEPQLMWSWSSCQQLLLQADDYSMW